MEEIRVQSWSELNERLYEHSWNEPVGRFRSPFVFRGLPDYRYDRRTSLNRLGGNYADLEDDLLRNFRKYAARETQPGESWWNWLALAQHHGLPTRLLDWTFSPYVALHFVTEKYDLFSVDGMIWSLNIEACNRFLPDSLKEMLHQEGATVFTAEMLARVAPFNADFDRAVGVDCVVFFEPPSLDERIVNQAALFSMMSSPILQLEDWLRAHENEVPLLSRKIVIPAPLKWEIRDKLDMANINERVIYPGLDGLSMWLKRYYSPNHIIEVTYPYQNAVHLGRITVNENARLRVELDNGVSVTLTCTPEHVWSDETNRCPVEIRPRPLPR